MKKVSSLLFVLILALPALACNFGASPPTATAPGAASNNTAVPTAAPGTPTTPPTAVPPTTAPTTAPSATTANTAAPDSTSVPSPVPNTTAVSGDCAPGSGKAVTTASELKIEDLTICPGSPAQTGMTATIHFVGTLRDGGARFYSTIERGQPVSFIIGNTSDLVPKGLSEGIVGMTVGSKRRLTVPPLLGYGTQGRQGVPANATLVYEVQLLGVK